MPGSRRRVEIWKAAAGALAVAAGVGLVLGKILHARPPIVASVALSVVLLGLALAAANGWWRRIDDMARDAHTTAWWWGGCFGAGVGFVVAVALGGSARSPLVQGAALLFGCECVAYAVVWSAWWLARRPRAPA